MKYYRGIEELFFSAFSLLFFRGFYKIFMNGPSPRRSREPIVLSAPHLDPNKMRVRITVAMQDGGDVRTIEN